MKYELSMAAERVDLEAELKTLKTRLPIVEHRLYEIDKAERDRDEKLHSGLRIEPNGDGRFVILRGPYLYDKIFVMFIDHDRCSWSQVMWYGAAFETREKAEETLAEIRRRDKSRRSQKTVA